MVSPELVELHLLENARQDRDRRVLEAYPLFTELLRPADEPSPKLERSDPALLDRLGQSGWRGPLLTSPFVYTEGRIYVGEDGPRRGRRLRIDGLLRAEASLPIALVHTTRPGEDSKVSSRRGLHAVADARMIDLLGRPEIEPLDLGQKPRKVTPLPRRSVFSAGHAWVTSRALKARLTN